MSSINLSKYAPLTWYQESMIVGTVKIFGECEMRMILSRHLPHYDELKSIKLNCIEGGSIAYNILIENTTNLPLKLSLQNHGLSEKYAFIYVWSDDLSVIDKSRIWYTSREICHRKANIAYPSKDICGNLPIPLKFIFSHCIHCETSADVALPQIICRECYYSWNPQRWNTAHNITLPELQDNLNTTSYR